MVLTVELRETPCPASEETNVSEGLRGTRSGTPEPNISTEMRSMTVQVNEVLSLRQLIS